MQGRQPPPPRAWRAPRNPPLAPRAGTRGWCPFAPPLGFGEFRVPVLGEKGLKAHLDLSPEAGPVAEVRSLGQRNPGRGTRVTSSSPVSGKTPPELRGRSWGSHWCESGSAAVGYRARSGTSTRSPQPSPGVSERFRVELCPSPVPLQTLPLEDRAHRAHPGQASGCDLSCLVPWAVDSWLSPYGFYLPRHPGVEEVATFQAQPKGSNPSKDPGAPVPPGGAVP